MKVGVYACSTHAIALTIIKCVYFMKRVCSQEYTFALIHKAILWYELQPLGK